MDPKLRRLALTIQKLLDEPKSEPTQDRWERSKTIAGWVAAIAVPLVLGISGYYVNINIKSIETRTSEDIKNKELESARILKGIDTNAAMIKLAIEILKEQPQESDDNQRIRSWAVDVINRYSDVKMPEETRNAVIKNEPLVGRSIRPDPAEYRRLFEKMKLNGDQAQRIREISEQIILNRAKYESVEKETGVPWAVIAAIHWVESSGNFNVHLHNGDSLSQRTVTLPAGRPKDGVPPFTWFQSASDALRLAGLSSVSQWTIEEALYQLEHYNGMGYRKFHSEVLSPYLWGGSDQYTKGKYGVDGIWEAEEISHVVGAAVILKFSIPPDSLEGLLRQ